MVQRMAPLGVYLHEYPPKGYTPPKPRPRPQPRPREVPPPIKKLSQARMLSEILKSGLLPEGAQVTRLEQKNGAISFEYMLKPEKMSQALMFSYVLRSQQLPEGAQITRLEQKGEAIHFEYVPKQTKLSQALMFSYVLRGGGLPEGAQVTRLEQKGQDIHYEYIVKAKPSLPLRYSVYLQLMHPTVAKAKPSLPLRYSFYLHLMRPREPPQTILQKQETYEEWLAKQGTPYAGRPTEKRAPVSPPIVSGAPYPGGGRVIVPEQVHKPYRPAIERPETPWARFLRAESPAERYGRGLQQAERLQVAPVRPFGVPVEQRYGIVGFIGEAERQVRQTFAPGKGELKGAHPSHLRTVREWERRYPGYMAGVAAFRFAEIAVVSKGIEKGLGVMKKAVGGREWLLGPERYAEAQWQLIGYKPAPEYKSPFKKPSRIERVTTPLKRVVLGEKRYAESLWREMGVLKAEKMARLTSPLPQIGRGLPLEFYYHAPVRYDVTYALGRVVPKGAKIFYSPLTAQFLWKAPTYIPKKAPSLVPVTKEYEVFLQRGVMELKPHKVLVHTPKKGWHYQEFMFEEKFAKETYPWVKPIWKTGKKGFAQVSLLIQKQRVAQITRTPFQVTLQKTLTPKLPTKIGEATKMFVGVTQITKVTPTRKRPVEKITPQLITKPFPSIVEAWKLREYHAVTPKRIQRQRQKQIEKLRQIKITEPRLKQRERLTQKGRQRIDLVTEQVSIQRVYVPLRLSAMSARKIPPIPPLKLPRAGGFDERRFGIGFGEWFKRKHPILTPEQMVKKIGLGLPKRRKIKRRPIRFAL